MSKTLVRHLRDILVALIEEASPIPSGVMDCIIAQFEAQAHVSYPQCHARLC
jgi:sister-chromatid-cohesion protein PDS5